MKSVNISIKREKMMIKIAENFNGVKIAPLKFPKGLTSRIRGSLLVDGC